MGLTAEALEGVWARLSPGVCVGEGSSRESLWASKPTGLMGLSYCLPWVKLSSS